MLRYWNQISIRGNFDGKYGTQNVTYDFCNQQGSVDCGTFLRFRKSPMIREVVDRIECPLEREIVMGFHPHLETKIGFY